MYTYNNMQPVQAMPPMQAMPNSYYAMDNRITYLENQLRNNQGQQMQPMQQVPESIVGKSVSNIQEVNDAIISLDGTIYTYPDIQHGTIYTKQLNMQNGQTVIRTYKLEQEEKKTDKDKDELLNMIADIEKRLNDHINGGT